jgi:beta-galactosidase
MRNLFQLVIVFIFFAFCGCKSGTTRNVISLNGVWDFELNSNPDAIPDSFTRKIQVPGLVDLAVPAIEKPGFKRDSNKYYWYKTKFTLNKSTDVCLLKIHKAQYGKKIFLNNKLVAEHFPSYTSLSIDISKFLNNSGSENELVIRIGSFYNFPDSFVAGNDFEKQRFISGIYDDVELIQSSFPFIQNVQVAPDINKKCITVLSEINSEGKSGKFNFEYIVKEHKTGKEVCKGSTKVVATGGIDTSRIVIEIPNCKLWSPKDPFLYDLTLNTGSDSYNTRFGMREFKFDTVSGRAKLNGKIFYMNGTCVPVFRFFEDSLRGNYPWNKEWVRKLNTQFLSLNWNVIRYHVGPAPDFWYDLADEMGILIQDEFAIWFGYGHKDIRPNLRAKNIAAEYKDWMRERWNHPCVIIWDAQNESVTPETGKAINMVRNLDLSNRPWDNGWSRPQSPTDAIESHPYLFHEYREKITKLPDEGILKSLFGKVRQPYNDPGEHDSEKGKVKYNNIRFINEYGWLWVNRDGSATTLSENVYKNLYGDTVTNEQRLYLYARLEALLTEYWRCHRTCTGVMHFAGLTYSRPNEPRGQTSDNFKNLETLEFDPFFLKYVKPAFQPVCLMVDTWEKEYKSGEIIDVPVHIINDLYSDWQGEMLLTISISGKIVSSQKISVAVKSLGKEIKNFKVEIPKNKGKYEIQATIKLNNEDVFSVRDMLVK